MKRTLSKEQLADLAQQAVSSLRRLMSSSQEVMTLTQQDLLSTSKSIEECWQKKHLAADISVVELWASSFQEELSFQLERSGGRSLTHNGNAPRLSTEGPIAGKKAALRKPIGESAILMCTDVLKILMRTNGEKSADIFLQCHLTACMINYLMQVPLAKKVRDAFSSVLLEVIGYNSLLLEECLVVSHGHLVPDTEQMNAFVVTSQQVHLAWLLALVFRRVDVNNVPVETARIQSGRNGFLSGLLRACSMLAGEGVEGMSEGMQITSCLAYLGLVSSLVRGCAANKALCLGRHREELTRVWVHAASNIWKVELTLPISTNTPGKDALLAVEGVQAWASELTDFLVEVATSDSFSLRRQAMHENSMNNNGSADAMHTNGSPPLSPSPLSSPGVSRANRRYEPLPPHWDAILTGGSPPLWRLASLLFNCVLSEEGCGFITEALLRMDTQNATSELIYRSNIATLMLLCISTPRNVEVLAKSSIVEALIALITCRQESVFSREVVVLGKVCTPTHALSAYAVQLTVSFMSTMASLYMAEGTLPRLKRGVEKMCLQQTSQTDADIIESFLHVLSCTGVTRSVLFFSGSGSVVCKIDRFSATRFYGYSFAAWVFPKCVWSEGSHLFSYTDNSSGTSVVLAIVANGRSCNLLLRVQHANDVTLSLIPDTSFPADAWSHLAFTHNLSGFTLFLNGRRTENALSVPFPKTPSKKQRLQLAFGGFHEGSSFFGFIASIELFDNTLTEKEVQRMHQAGPRPSRELSLSCHPLLSVENQVVAGTNLFSVGVTGNLAAKHEGVSVHSVVAFNPPNMQERFVCEDVVNWALRTLVEAKKSPTSFPVAARLCVKFVCTAMKLTTTEEELNRMVDEVMMGQLREEVLTWSIMPIEVPAILIDCTLPRGGGKVMRTHHTTQIILSLLLDVVSDQFVSACATSCILRELSDILLLTENLALFRAVPGRFRRLLAVSVHLPLECVENLIILVERLCKEQREMEQTLQFLLSEPASRTSDFVKAEMLHMLFDIARTNPAMCDLIGGAFGNCGVSFLISLVGGKNHTSEAIRVFALRIISLMQHTNKKFREMFVKSHGYDVLAAVMTKPSSVPIRLATFNCLFQMAFDTLQPTTEGDSILTHLQQGASSKVRRRAMRHQDPNTLPKGGVGQSLGLQGYFPGMVSQKLRVTRREYSFDTTHDFAHNKDARLLLDDSHRGLRTRGKSNTAIQEPQAIYIILYLLGHLLRSVSTAYTSSLAAPRDPVISRESSTDANAAAQDDRVGNNAVDNVSTASIVSPIQEDTPEIVSLRVLCHLEKIVDRPENGEMLLPYPWLTWLWDAVGQVFGPASGNGVDSPPKFPKKHAAAFQQRMRNIVHSLAILDLSRNSKAGIVRILRQTDQSPLLTKLVLEDIVCHFTKNRCEISDKSTAANIIKNLDSLFHNIEEVLRPLPLALGLEIVNSISAIAVNNNSWVRTRMKNTSHLFETRNHLGFVILVTTKKFSKLDPVMLGQLLEANEHEPNTIRVLLRRLITAASNCDADEVEVLLAAARRLVNGDQNHYQAVFSIIGAEYRSFADLLCGGVGGKSGSSSLNIERPSLSPSFLTTRSEEKANADELPASEVIQWCREDEGRWEIIRLRVWQATKFLDAIQDEDVRDGKNKNQAVKTKRVDDRRQSIQNKITLEIERISQDVDSRLCVHSSAGSSAVLSPSNSLVKPLAATVSAETTTTPTEVTRVLPL
ncbi:chaperone DNAJ protein [Trypanosoma grayi]|uniref:chaperone DNAJ protein n=1 Tax=Trypanosoma grayi TaxID=71804 RepID=UPI0004F4411E|nr:chaperone DNAJ protein [Trypanosoma grayi]KEG13721.1 chaperone DNAJ protein [Trypanosoma grayi]